MQRAELVPTNEEGEGAAIGAGAIAIAVSATPKDQAF